VRLSDGGGAFLRRKRKYSRELYGAKIRVIASWPRMAVSIPPDDVLVDEFNNHIEHVIRAETTARILREALAQHVAYGDTTRTGELRRRASTNGLATTSR
jgi:hypothetical protein